MRAEKIVSVIICIISVVGLSYAQDENLNEEKRFSNETSISLVNTTGNTDTLSFAGKNDMTYKFSEKWTGSWLVGEHQNFCNPFFNPFFRQHSPVPILTGFLKRP